MSNPAHLLCFAVREEVSGLPPALRTRPDVKILLTGMGAKRAREATLRALEHDLPRRVISSGFAGGLNPLLRRGQVVFDAAPGDDLVPALEQAGARPARFHCSDRVVVTAAAKEKLWRETAADAVEMESGVIRALCAERGIPAVTVRVISDEAMEDLPLDFNKLMKADQQISLRHLLGALGRSPWKVRGLLQLQQRIRAAAARLGETLARVIPA